MTPLAYDRFRLHIAKDALYVESLNAGAQNVLLIDRLNGSLELQKTSKVEVPPALSESKEIFGIFGSIKLNGGNHLIVITERARVGEILGHTIWRVESTEIIPYQRSSLNLNEAQISDNKSYLSLLEKALATESYYFCTTFDITHSIQRLASTDDGFHSESLCNRADTRFFWNHFALQDYLTMPELHNFIFPIMLGFVKIVSCFVRGRTFDLALISRRSTLRVGTRYFVRGMNENGDAANFVETEQVLTYANNICSIVQTRGSIPLVWSQRPNIKYKPTIRIDKNQSKHIQVFNRHFDEQIVQYGKQVAISLVNLKGYELGLAQKFMEIVNETKNQNISYEAFDFHKECGSGKWHRLSILMDKIDLEQKQFGYFMQDRDGNVFMQQSGVFRTNCMDCLDRTNVVQSLIARRSLKDQLVQLGIFSPATRIEDEGELDYIMKQMWADNADACSNQYAGTGALKTDYTRTGKRTTKGIMMDGWNSAVRYFKNNFADGFRQDSMDLLLGNYVVTDDKSPFCGPMPSQKVLLIFGGYIAFSLLCIVSLIPASGTLEQLSYIAFWGLATWLLLTYVARHGVDFVNAPKLVHMKDKVD